jgi:hypothetical protein
MSPKNEKKKKNPRAKQQRLAFSGSWIFRFKGFQVSGAYFLGFGPAGRHKCKATHMCGWAVCVCVCVCVCVVCECDDGSWSQFVLPKFLTQTNLLTRNNG